MLREIKKLCNYKGNRFIKCTQCTGSPGIGNNGLVHFLRDLLHWHQCGCGWFESVIVIIKVDSFELHLNKLMITI